MLRRGLLTAAFLSPFSADIRTGFVFKRRRNDPRRCFYDQSEKIAEDNFLDAFALKLGEGQERFVSHPVRSLAQAYVYRDQCRPFGIYDGDSMVGYVLVIYDYDIPEYDIWHMMIDASRQGKGYGREGLRLALDYIRTKPFGDAGRVALTCHRDNAAALALYRAAGFAETGEEDGDELELALCLA